MNKIEELLMEYSIIVKLPVLWGQMDAERHVNNVSYMRYLESGRVAYFYETTKYNKTINPRPILANVNCQYRFPLTYPDKVYIGTRVNLDKFGKHSFLMEQIVVSERHQRIAAIGTAVLVYFDFKTQQKALLPEEARQVMMAFEEKHRRG